MKQAEPSDYEFQQLVAEAVHRVGKSAVERYLSAAARDFGWPIPPQHRAHVGAELATWVQLTEGTRRVH